MLKAMLKEYRLTSDCLLLDVPLCIRIQYISATMMTIVIYQLVVKDRSLVIIVSNKSLDLM